MDPLKAENVNEDNPIDPNDDNNEQNNEISSEQDHQVIFEQTFNDLMNKFGEQCQQHNIECAIAIAQHPNYDEPMVFYRAPHIFDAASLMAKILRQIKTELYDDLNTEDEHQK